MDQILFIYFYPTLSVEKPCALFCSPVGKEQPILLSEKVLDGTSCGYQGLDICANGMCQVRHSKRESVYAEGGLGDLRAAAQYSGKLCLNCDLQQV